jgi:WhiB family transcriptional regulator, redox-sensing transcriptional regulator
MTDLDWRQLAACRRHPALHPDAWFPDPSDIATRAAAVRVCRTQCPVQQHCAQEALRIKPGWGIWGGMTQKQISTLLGVQANRRRWSPNALPAQCGTPAAYKRHLRDGETACDACLQANRRAQNHQAARR